MLGSLFAGGLRYTPDTTVAEGDRVAVQAQARCTFADGQAFVQDYMVMFRLRGGLVLDIGKYDDTSKVAELIIPRIKALMATGR